MTYLKRLHGKVAVVTGSGSGIGQECALRFAREGATVIGVDLDAVAWITATDLRLDGGATSW